MKYLVCFLILISFYNKSLAQQGCTDPLSSNYNPAATINDGSCQYPLTSRQLSDKVTLPASLNETSGLVYTNDKLYTMNDGGDQAAFYQLDESSGTIIQTIRITNATNIDWEAITADSDYIYIGDFGNNANGNRANLRIYRVLQSAIGTDEVVEIEAEIILFTYQDQGQVLDPSGSNNTAFDCEAFIVKDGMLHLFSKDWINDRSKQYTLPAQPGTQVAEPVDSFFVNGLITDASLAPNGLIVLTGYTKSFTDVFLWLLYDYSDDKFFSGNKRQVQIGKTLDIANRSQDRGQVEGIAFSANGEGYISNERIQREVFGFTMIVQPMLHSFSVSDLVSLPATISRFSLLTEMKSVVLSWSSEEESSLSYYAVERSDRSMRFEEIGKVPAANTAVDYRYRDRNPLAGENFYRLRIVDIDESETYSITRNIRFSEKSNSLKLNATIVAGNVIKLINAEEGLPFKVFSSGGSTVLHGILNRSGQINIDTLNRGMYFIAFSNGETARFIKQ